MLRYEYYEVVRPIKNLPFKSGDFIRGYKLGNCHELGGYALGETRKKELIKAELTRILLGRHTH